MLKSEGVVGGVGGWVAHKILVTAPEAKSPFPFLNLTQTLLWTGIWPQACDFKSQNLGLSKASLQG